MTPRRKKPRYAPLPVRALQDKSLSLLMLRLLLLVAAHDCFGTYGMGCTANHRRLAEILGVATKSVTRAINRLVELEYLSSEQNRVDARLREYRILYTDEDHAIFESKLGPENLSTKRASNSGARYRKAEQPIFSVTEDVTSVTNNPTSVTIESEFGNGPCILTHSNHWKTTPPIEEVKYNNENTTLSNRIGECKNYHSLKPNEKNDSLQAVSLIDSQASGDLGLHDIFTAWVKFTGTPTNLSPVCQQSLRDSVKRYGSNHLIETIKRARASPFLRGERGDWNGMPIKWLWNDDRIFEINNGQYDDKSSIKKIRNSSGKLAILRGMLDRAKNDGCER